MKQSSFLMALLTLLAWEGSVEAKTDVSPTASTAVRAESSLSNSLGEAGRQRVTLRRENADAHQALGDLLAAARASYVIGHGAPSARRVTFHLQNVRLEDAFGSVAEAAGLRYRVRGGVILLTSLEDPSPSRAPAGTRHEASWATHIVNDGGRTRTFRVLRDDSRRVEPRIEMLRPSRQGLRREVWSLRDMTVEQLFNGFRWSRQEMETRHGRLMRRLPDPDRRDSMDGLTRLEGNPNKRTLQVEGTPEALHTLLTQINRL